MIEITYLNDAIDKFDIYYESDEYIMYKDLADNVIRINKKELTTHIWINDTWTEFSNIKSYRKI